MNASGLLMNTDQHSAETAGSFWRGETLLAIFDNRWVQSALLLIVLLLLLPPDGILSDNEENYFQLAAKTATGGFAPPYSGIFDSSPHRYVFEQLLGNLISLVGYEPAQIITRTLAAVGFALLLPPVFRLFAISALDGAIIVIAFALLDQNLMGGEWIFFGFEAKVVAYGFVLAALYAVRTRRDLMVAMVLCTIATYFHFLVGVFWFAALLGLRLIDDRKGVTRIVFAALAFALATAPLTGTILWMRLHDQSVAAVLDTPTPDVIFSLIREPWHGAPFFSRYNFVVDWLPGYFLASAMFASCVFIARTTTEPKQRRFALWLSFLIGYLFLALILAFIERHSGAIGKFYPFRPSSLILFLWLALAAAWLNGVITRHRPMIKILTLALLAPAFFNIVLLRLVHDMSARATFAGDKTAIATYLMTASGEGAVTLIDPAVEASFLDLERLTGRPFLISWKFAPTNNSELREWYRRMEFRKTLFRDGCPQTLTYRVDFLLATPANATSLSQTCGPIVLETEHWRLLRRRTFPE